MGLSLSRQVGWCRSRAGGMPMGAGTEDVRLGLNRPAAVVPLDSEQALGIRQCLGITFDLFTTTHGESRRSRGWLVTGALAGAGAMLVGVYKINASNAMPKPYLTVYIYTYVRVVYREQYLQTNANARERK